MKTEVWDGGGGGAEVEFPECRSTDEEPDLFLGKLWLDL